MRRGLLGAAILGAGGAAILGALGVWQLQRLAWKEDLLARMEARIAAGPVALPQDPQAGRDDYLSVTVTGRYGLRNLRVQSARDGEGAGYRIITGFDSRRGSLMIDRGFVLQGAPVPEVPHGVVMVTGNLLWPDESGAMTPAPDMTAGLFYARDLTRMGILLGTAPVLLVRREGAGGGGSLRAYPVGTGAIRNDHKEYAITWFTLAAVWLAMAAYLIYRMRKQEEGKSS